MTNKVKMRYALLVFPVAAALVANAAIAVDKGSGGVGLDSDEVLVWSAVTAAVLVALGIGWRHWSADNPEGESAVVAVSAGVLTFLLSWVPALVLITLYPPS